MTQLYPEEGYGYLTTPGGREIRFTRATVLRDEFDLLNLGSEVRFEETRGTSGTNIYFPSVPGSSR